MKNQNSHKKSIENHIKSIELKIGSKPQNLFNVIRKPTRPFIESDVENDSSDISGDQEKLDTQKQHKKINNQLQIITRRNGAMHQNIQKDKIEIKPAKFYQILQLPTAQYKKTQNELDVCSICLQQWQQRETYKILPCTHVLHLNCAKDWLTQKNQCPMCKITVFYE